jgi:hypothetical protein
VTVIYQGYDPRTDGYADEVVPAPVVLTLKRCANRCGALKPKHDIYCPACRAEITAEAWRLIEAEPDPVP